MLIVQFNKSDDRNIKGKNEWTVKIQFKKFYTESAIENNKGKKILQDKNQKKKNPTSWKIQFLN